MTFEDLTNEFSDIEETKRLLETKQTQEIMKAFTPMQLTVLMLNMEIKAYHSVEQFKQKVKDAINKFGDILAENQTCTCNLPSECDICKIRGAFMDMMKDLRLTNDI